MSQPPQGPPPAYSQPPPQGMYPNQPYQVPPGAYNQQSQQSQQSTTTIITTQPQTTVVAGGCACGGMVSESFTVCGILLAICFFPLGVLCCFLLMEKRCTRCGRVF